MSSKVIFQRLLVPFHSHTLLNPNEVAPRLSTPRKRLKEKKKLSAVLLQHSSESQAQLLLTNFEKQVSEFERETTRKGMKGMEPLTVTCSQGDLRLFSVLGTGSKIQQSHQIHRNLCVTFPWRIVRFSFAFSTSSC